MTPCFVHRIYFNGGSVSSMKMSYKYTCKGWNRYSLPGCFNTPVRKPQVLIVVVVVFSRFVNYPTASLSNLYKALLTVSSK